MSPIKAVRGVRDILPEESQRWQRVESAARRTFEAYGYEEIRIPLFERTELFARGIGGETDIVTKEMYTFEDKGGESLTLRPEATASLMRAYISCSNSRDEYTMASAMSLRNWSGVTPGLPRNRPPA